MLVLTLCFIRILWLISLMEISVFVLGIMFLCKKKHVHFVLFYVRRSLFSTVLIVFLLITTVTCPASVEFDCFLCLRSWGYCVREISSYVGRLWCWHLNLGHKSNLLSCVDLMGLAKKIGEQIPFFCLACGWCFTVIKKASCLFKDFIEVKAEGEFYGQKGVCGAGKQDRWRREQFSDCFQE